MAKGRRIGKAIDFSNIVKNGKMDDGNWQQFCQLVQGMLDSINQNGGSNSSTNNAPQTSNIGTGGGGLAGSQAPTGGTGISTPGSSQFITLRVPTGSLTVFAGRFVNYSATTGTPVMQLADCRYVDRFATHYVARIDSGVAELCPVWSSGNVKYATGKNTTSSAILYLYRDGEVTDDRNDIINPATRKPQAGVVWEQQLGTRIAEKGQLLCRATIWIGAPRGPLS